MRFAPDPRRRAPAGRRQRGNARLAVLSAVEALLPPSGRCVVGVDGVDGAGKTRFAAALVEHLRTAGLQVASVAADDHLNPEAVRYRRGRDDPEGFYRDSYDTTAIRGAVAAAGPGVVVLAGMFLQSPALAGTLDVVVFLRVPFGETYRRMAARDGCAPDPDDAANRRYRRGQQLYLDEVDPAATADVLVENSDPGAPVLLRLDRAGSDATGSDATGSDATGSDATGSDAGQREG